MIGFLSGSTCGDACWHAREDVCHCSCGGANHGCLRGLNGVRPIRTAKVNGDMCQLRAVGFGLDKEAIAINKEAGIDYYGAHTARQTFGFNPIARMRPATESQVARWPELAAYRHLIKSTWRESNPNACAIHYPGLPYLLWTKLCGAYGQTR